MIPTRLESMAYAFDFEIKYIRLRNNHKDGLCHSKSSRKISEFRKSKAELRLKSDKAI